MAFFGWNIEIEAKDSAIVPSRMENKMGTAPMGRLLTKMSLPLVCSMLAQGLYGMIDSLFVAQLGGEALTAMSLCMSVQFLLVGAGAGIGVGINTLLSKKLGQQDQEGVNKTAANGMLIVIVTSLLFLFVALFALRPLYRMQTNIETILNMSVSYSFIICAFSFASLFQTVMERLLSSTGRTHMAMVSMIVGTVINLILDPILIFGWFGIPPMGIAGAAYATVIGQGVAAITGIIVNLRKNKDIQFLIKAFKPDFAILIGIIKIGVPVALNQCLISLLAFGMNNILMPLSSIAPGIYVAYIRLQSFAIMPAAGINNANVSIMAYNYGAKKKARIMQAFWLSIKGTLVVSLIAMLLFQFFPQYFLALFNASEKMLEIGIPAFHIIATGMPILCVTMILTGFLQALGRGNDSFLIALAQAVLLVGIGWLLSLSGNVVWVWFAFPITEALRVSIALVFVRHSYRKRISIIEA